MNNIFAAFNDPEMAEKAGGALLDHGVRAEHISIVLPEGAGSTGRGDNTHKPRDGERANETGITTTTMEDAQAGAAAGAGIGLVAGTAVALAAIFVPGIGLVLGGGALALALGGMAGTTAAGAVAGGVTGFLKDQGVPSDVTDGYERVIRGGGALLTVFPSDEKIEQATIESILAKYNGSVSSYSPTRTAAGTLGDKSRVEAGSPFDTVVAGK